MAPANTLSVGYTDTKDVLRLIIGLGMLYKNAQEDGKINLSDIQHLLPVLFLIGPAIDNFENVQLELKMASKEEGDELKQWVNEQVDLKDKTVEEFVEASFAIVLDIWMVFRTFFFPDETENRIKQPVQPEADGNVGPNTATDIEYNGNVVEDTGEGTDVKVDSAKPSAK